MLSLTLFSRPTITLDGSPITTLTNKGEAILYYLATTRQPHSRTALAGLLWSDTTESNARRNLRVELAKIRPQFAPYLIIQRQTLSFDTHSNYTLDVEQFSQNLQRPEPTLTHLETATQHYTGPFLNDFHLRGAALFEEWQLVQREYYHQQTLDALHQLIQRYTEQQQHTAGITTARQLLTLEPWLETAHRQLMRLLALNGQRAAALTQFEHCQTILMDELGVEPAAETLTLHQQILNNQLAPPPTTHHPPPTTHHPPPTPPIPFQPPPPATHFTGRQPRNRNDRPIFTAA